MKLTLEQRARRATTRRNNEIKKRYPLFAVEFATTPEAEAARLVKQGMQAEARFAEMRIFESGKWGQGARYRHVAKQLLTAERFSEVDSRFWKIYQMAREKVEWYGYRFADWWWIALRGYQWAFDNCPNREYHNEPLWWYPQWDFLQSAFVEPMKCPTCWMPRNLTTHPLDQPLAECMQAQLFN